RMFAFFAFLIFALLMYKDPANAAQEPECFFSEKRTTEHETCPNREFYSSVSPTCSGARTRLSDLQKIEVSENGATNELELALGRGAGIFDDATFAFAAKWNKKFICEHHLNELVRKWGQVTMHHSKRRHTTHGWRTLCGIPEHDRAVMLRHPYYLTREMARNYLVNNHKFEQMDWKESPEPEDRSPVSVVKAPFEAFVKASGVRGACSSPDFATFMKETKERRVLALRRLIKIMIGFLAPGSESELTEMLESSFAPRVWKDAAENKIRKVLFEVADQYEKETDRRSKELILSAVVDVFPYRELQEFIPDLSVRKFYNAKYRAIRKGNVKEHPIIRTRYEPVRVNLFVTFITSPFISTGLPFKERTVKKSDGSLVHDREHPKHSSSLQECRNLENV
ncbi:hypothetical protein PFISCL1PPCAC_20854, partial [Pristionchus fissidentatus]